MFQIYRSLAITTFIHPFIMHCLLFSLSKLFLLWIFQCISDMINFQALDTLGGTKWRINKKLLSVVESIWAEGGNIGGLVDRNDVSTDR